MGRPSDKRRAARRPGKRERAQVKKHHRSKAYGNVPGVGTYALTAGQKKWTEFHRSRRNPFSWTRDLIAHPAGEAYPESGEQTRHGQAKREVGVAPYPAISMKEP